MEPIHTQRAVLLRSSCQQDHGAKKLQRGVTNILQLNIGLYCNQACSHCHVESSPLRKEMMDRRTAQRCLELAEDAIPHGLRMLDLTGGAPELNPQFTYVHCCDHHYYCWHELAPFHALLP